MPQFQTIIFDMDQTIARITLNRPDAANGINLLMAQELMQAVTLCEQQDQLRAILITANGKMFCAGGDVKAFAAMGDAAASEIRQLMVNLHAAIAGLLRLPAPVIIAVNGMAAGAGFSLACAGDIVYAGTSAKFTMAYTAIGLSPDGGASFILPRLIGLRRTQELMLGNRKLTAEEAHNWGIVTDIMHDQELQAAAWKTAHQLAQGPTRAYTAVKQLLHSSFQQAPEAQMEDEARLMASMINSDDGKEGIRAFVEKRLPQFKGK